MIYSPICPRVKIFSDSPPPISRRVDDVRHRLIQRSSPRHVRRSNQDSPSSCSASTDRPSRTPPTPDDPSGSFLHRVAVRGAVPRNKSACRRPCRPRLGLGSITDRATPSRARRLSRQRRNMARAISYVRCPTFARYRNRLAPFSRKFRCIIRTRGMNIDGSGDSAMWSVRKFGFTTRMPLYRSPARRSSIGAMTWYIWNSPRA